MKLVRPIFVRRLVQATAALLGLGGLMWVCIVLGIMLELVRTDKGLGEKLGLGLWFAPFGLLGAIFATMAYFVIRRYSVSSIRSFSVSATLVIWIATLSSWGNLPLESRVVGAESVIIPLIVSLGGIFAFFFLPFVLYHYLTIAIVRWSLPEEYARLINKKSEYTEAPNSPRPSPVP